MPITVPLEIDSPTIPDSITEERLFLFAKLSGILFFISETEYVGNDSWLAMSTVFASLLDLSAFTFFSIDASRPKSVICRPLEFWL